MPRGGEGLIRAVAECSKVPVIKHYKGVCHVYVDADADLKMAEEIAINAKVQRPGRLQCDGNFARGQSDRAKISSATRAEAE